MNRQRPRPVADAASVGMHADSSGTTHLFVSPVVSGGITTLR